MPMPRSFVKLFFLLALSSAALSTSGCYGHFPLTRQAYRLNGEITDNEFVHSLVMWAFVVLAYPYAALADVLVLNPIEFWSGEQIEFKESSPETRWRSSDAGSGDDILQSPGATLIARQTDYVQTVTP